MGPTGLGDGENLCGGWEVDVRDTERERQLWREASEGGPQETALSDGPMTPRSISLTLVGNCVQTSIASLFPQTWP